MQAHQHKYVLISILLLYGTKERMWQSNLFSCQLASLSLLHIEGIWFLIFDLIYFLAKRPKRKHLLILHHACLFLQQNFWHVHIVRGWSLWLVTVTSLPPKHIIRWWPCSVSNKWYDLRFFSFGAVYLSQIAPLTLEWRFGIWYLWQLHILSRERAFQLTHWITLFGHFYIVLVHLSSLYC